MAKVMTQETADKYYEMIYRFSLVMEKLKLQYWIEGGTLIGAMREGAILSWDKDADIHMLEKDRKILWDNKELIESFGIKTDYADDIYRIIGSGVYMDVFSFEYKNGFYQEIHLRNRQRWPRAMHIKKSMIWPLRRARFGPLRLPVLYKAEEYLEQAFGDWRTIPPQYRHLPVYKVESSNRLDILINGKPTIPRETSFTRKKNNMLSVFPSFKMRKI